MPIDIATFRPRNAGDFLDALVQVAQGELRNKWTRVEGDLRPYLQALAQAAARVRLKLASGEYTQQDADFALHGQELAINQFFQYARLVVYATAQSLINALFRTVSQLIRNSTGIELSWLF